MASLLLGGCGVASPAACPADLPAACPSPAPSFDGSVHDVIVRRCAICHGPNGENPGRPLETYEQIVPQRSEMLSQVYACRMPPPGAAPPTESERLALLGWLVCGAPNN